MTILVEAVKAGFHRCPVRAQRNPPAYRTVVDTGVLRVLVDQSNIVAIKESAPDTRRFTDIRNAFGDRFVLCQ